MATRPTSERFYPRRIDRRGMMERKPCALTGQPMTGRGCMVRGCRFAELDARDGGVVRCLADYRGARGGRQR